MKLLLAALAVTFAIAVTASVFAIWPAVADAPWEDEKATLRVDQGETVLCDIAILLRDNLQGWVDLLEGGIEFTVPMNSQGSIRPAEARDLLNAAEREIDRYC